MDYLIIIANLLWATVIIMLIVHVSRAKEDVNEMTDIVISVATHVAKLIEDVEALKKESAALAARVEDFDLAGERDEEEAEELAQKRFNDGVANILNYDYRTAKKAGEPKT